MRCHACVFSPVVQLLTLPRPRAPLSNRANVQYQIARQVCPVPALVAASSDKVDGPDVWERALASLLEARQATPGDAAVLGELAHAFTMVAEACNPLRQREEDEKQERLRLEAAAEAEAAAAAAAAAAQEPQYLGGRRHSEDEDFVPAGADPGLWERKESPSSPQAKSRSGGVADDDYDSDENFDAELRRRQEAREAKQITDIGQTKRFEHRALTKGRKKKQLKSLAQQFQAEEDERRGRGWRRQQLRSNEGIAAQSPRIRPLRIPTVEWSARAGARVFTVPEVEDTEKRSAALVRYADLLLGAHNTFSALHRALVARHDAGRLATGGHGAGTRQESLAHTPATINKHRQGRHIEESGHCFATCGRHYAHGRLGSCCPGNVGNCGTHV